MQPDRNTSAVVIREARAPDAEAIRAVHLDAFDEEGATVAPLALALLADASAQPVLALVAEVDGEVVGNVIFSAAQMQGAEQVSACILAPLAVVRRFQGMGIGRKLIEQGLATLRERGVAWVFVLGDPRHYTRYGFSAEHQVRAPYALEYPEAWMVMSLHGDALDSIGGQLQCAQALRHPEHW